MLTRVEENDMKNPTMGLVQYLMSLDEIYPNPYIGENAVIEWILHIADARELCTFYAYAVWCGSKSVRLGNLKTHRLAYAFYRMGERLAKDNKLLQSVQRRPVEDYLKTSKNTAAYKAIAFEVSRL